MKEEKIMKESNVEYRTTKEIVEGIVRNAARYSNFEYKSIYKEVTKQMFYCVKKNDSQAIYELKITKKVRSTGERLKADNNNANRDSEKQDFLMSLYYILVSVFKNVNFHDGNVLISDNNNDYIISMIKKSGLSWTNPYEKKTVADT